MKRVSLILLTVGVALSARTALPIEFIATNRFVVASNETVSGELWLNAQSVELSGTADDDFFVFAMAPMAKDDAPPGLRITGTVMGDLWAVAQNMQLDGNLNRHARVLGAKTVSVSGKVARNLAAAGNAVYLDDTADVGGDLLAFGRDIIADGHVRGDARITGSHVTLAGIFDRDVVVTANDITVMPGTRIGRDLRYLMEKDLVLDSTVTLGRNMIRMDPPPSPRESFSTGGLLIQLLLYGAALLGGLGLVGLFPGIVALSAQKLTESLWRTLILGFVVICLMPMTAILLFVTLVGIPLSMMIACLFPVVIYFSKIPVALCLGALVMRRRNGTGTLPVFAALAFGLLMMYAAVGLPFPVDFAMWIAFTLTGTGAFAAAIMDRRIPVIVPRDEAAESKPPPLPPAAPLA